jgi:hypothetical protein
MGYVRLCVDMLSAQYIKRCELQILANNFKHIILLAYSGCYTMSHLTSLTDVYLHDEDHSYAIQEPFASTFGNLLSINTRLLRNTEQRILDKLVEDLKSNTSYANWV